MQHSDIFEEYSKIMEDKGFVKSAQAYSDPTEKYSDKEWRANIEALYGASPKLNDSDTNVLEQAHPEPYIAAPSYDKTNGLIENLWEQNDIMMHILNKPVSGTVMSPVYAQNLINELIKIGFDADNKGEDEIRILADSCAVRLTEQLEKQAAGPWWAKLLKVAPMVIAAVVGLDVLKNQTVGLVNNGIKPDTDRAIEKFTKLEEVAYPDGKQICARWISALTYYKALSDKALDIMSRPSISPDEIKSEQGLDWVLKQAPKAQGTKEDLEAVDKYIRVSIKLLKNIKPNVELVKNINVQKENTSMGEWWNNVKSLFDAATGNEARDAALSLEALGKSIESTVQAYIGAIPEAKKAVEEHQNTFESIYNKLTETINPPKETYYKKPEPEQSINWPTVLGK